MFKRANGKRLIACDRVVRYLCWSLNKGLNVLTKQEDRAVTRTTRMVSIAELEQRILFRQARANYDFRRLDRRISSVGQWISTDKKPSVFQQVIWWMIDVLWFFWDLVLGFLEPIFSMFLFGLARVVLTIVITAFVIYVIYQLLTA